MPSSAPPHEFVRKGRCDTILAGAGDDEIVALQIILRAYCPRTSTDVLQLCSRAEGRGKMIGNLARRSEQTENEAVQETGLRTH